MNPQWLHAARAEMTNIEALRSTRQQVAENSARQAQHSTEFDVSGTGYVAIQTPVMFDCIFAEKPTLSMGIECTKFPQDPLARYPMVNVGTWKWVTEVKPEVRAYQERLERAATLSGLTAAASTKSKLKDGDLLYKGAYPYFHIDVSPLIFDAVLAQQPNVAFVLHLVWTGLAYKDLSASVMGELHSDSAVLPIQPGGTSA
jgi:hypothetical protein